MSITKILLTVEEAEAILSKVFEILDSYDFDRFHEVFAAELEYQGGLQKDASLEDFTQNLKKQMQRMPSMKTSHTREKIDIAPDGTVYASGTSTALFDAHKDSPVTIPMIGVFSISRGGPDDIAKVSKMFIYKDRLPFLPYTQKMPGMAQK